MIKDDLKGGTKYLSSTLNGILNKSLCPNNGISNKEEEKHN